MAYSSQTERTADANGTLPDAPMEGQTFLAPSHLNILERADVVQDKSISADDFPHAASAFAGKNDKVDVHKFAG